MSDRSHDKYEYPVIPNRPLCQGIGGYRWYLYQSFPPDENIYRPKLLDLQHVELPEGFKELREAIAENAHNKVPYADLPESEKEYDHIMAYC